MMHYALLISTMMFFMTLMKMLIQLPRPYQFSPDIIPITCSAQFGDPSGTTLRSTTMLVSLFLDFVHDKRVSLGQYLVCLGITAASVASVMWSRVYLASHTINQVLFGGAIAVLISLYMHNSVKP